METDKFIDSVTILAIVSAQKNGFVASVYIPYDANKKTAMYFLVLLVLKIS